MCLPKILFPVFMFAFIFFTSAHVHLAASISHFLTAAMKFLFFFFQRNSCPLFSLALALPLSSM